MTNFYEYLFFTFVWFNVPSINFPYRTITPYDREASEDGLLYVPALEKFPYFDW